MTFDSTFTRRSLLGQFATGLGGISVASLIARESRAEGFRSESTDRPHHHAPKAKRAIQIFCKGD
jgi:hypothetical protein